MHKNSTGASIIPLGCEPRRRRTESAETRRIRYHSGFAREIKRLPAVETLLHSSPIHSTAGNTTEQAAGGMATNPVQRRETQEKKRVSAGLSVVRRARRSVVSRSGSLGVRMSEQHLSDCKQRLLLSA